MKTVDFTRALLALVVFAAAILVTAPVHAEPAAGIWSSYTYFPYAEVEDGNAPEGMEVGVGSWQTGASFPLSFAQGRTVVLNKVGYEVMDIEVSGAAGDVDRVHSITYTLFLIQQLSDRWQAVAVATPGLASDFEGRVSGDDLTFAGVLGARYSFGERFALGAGIAYQRNFDGTPPLPFALVEWAVTPKLALNALLPMNATLLYSPWTLLDVGVFGELGGGRYHGDPDKFGVGNPQMDYSIAAAGVLAQVHLSRWAAVSFKGGYAFQREFAFYDGGDEAASYELSRSWYVQGGIELGM